MAIHTPLKALHIEGGAMLRTYGPEEAGIELVEAFDYVEAEYAAIDGPVLKDMIDKTLFAVSNDETRFHLNGILFESDGKTVKLVATDGHRLAKIEGKLAAPKLSTGVIIPKKGVVEIKKVLETGTAVVKDDVIMEFDPADQQYALEQAESELLEAEQEILKRRADVQAQQAADKVALLTAQFDLRRAELDAAVDADLIASNEYKIRQVELEDAKYRLSKVEQDVAHRATTGAALTLVAASAERPYGLMRVLRNEAGDVMGLVCEKDASRQQRAIRECTSGVFACRPAALRDGLASFSWDNVERERTRRLT